MNHICHIRRVPGYKPLYNPVAITMSFNRCNKPPMDASNFSRACFLEVGIISSNRSLMTSSPFSCRWMFDLYGPFIFYIYISQVIPFLSWHDIPVAVQLLYILFHFRFEALLVMYIFAIDALNFRPQRPSLNLAILLRLGPL